MSNISIEPQSIVHLCKTGLQRDNGHQLTFANASAQETYFLSTKKKSYTDFTYIRSNNSIQVGDDIESVRDCNYLMYKNTGFGTKWFYGFITDIEYVNENCTRVYFTTDSWQTFQFDYDAHKCFVEREHTNDDTVGSNTVPEDLELGEYISCMLQPSNSFNPDTCFVVATTNNVMGMSFTLNQKVPCGLYYTAFEKQADASAYINYCYSQYTNEHVVDSVFVTLKGFFSNWTDSLPSGISGLTITGKYSIAADFHIQQTIQVTKVNYLANNYIPRNNKLLTDPFSFLQVSNHSGQIVNYKWEDFNMLPIPGGNSTNIEFVVHSVLTPGGSIKAFPINYKNELNNHDDCIVLGKLPVGAFSGDAYTNWITQNGLNTAIDIATDTVNLAISAKAGNTMGVVNSGSGIAHSLARVYLAHKLPDNVYGNTNCGDVNYQIGLTTLEFKRMSIKEEYARIIDEYFDMFGYKTNRLKYPNLSGRENWNYVKTIGCTFDAKTNSVMSQQDVENIRNMFDNGVTLWHNPSTMYNYNVTNNIVQQSL